MQCTFKPETKNDWRLLLKLVQYVRTGTKRHLVAMVAAFEEQELEDWAEDDEVNENRGEL